LILSHLF